MPHRRLHVAIYLHTCTRIYYLHVHVHRKDQSLGGVKQLIKISFLGVDIVIIDLCELAQGRSQKNTVWTASFNQSTRRIIAANPLPEICPV